MFLNPTTAITGCSFFKICFAFMTSRAISWAVITISATGISVYCLIMEACKPLAMISVAPPAMAFLASITVSLVSMTRISPISNFFSCKILWAW